MKNKNRSTSSIRWLREHFNDKYVQQKQEIGLRSRAWFKLAEIQQNTRLLKLGMTVIDLGSSPGGWSQYAKTQIGKTGRIIACDILPMNPIIGVDFLQGDLRDESVLKTLIELVGDNRAQIIMSDMAPNLSGIPEIDIPKSMHLVKLTLKICCNLLIPGGSFIVKVFHGENFKEYLKEICSLFMTVKVCKPNSSRNRSREEYIVATGRKP